MPERKPEPVAAAGPRVPSNIEAGSARPGDTTNLDSAMTSTASDRLAALTIRDEHRLRRKRRVDEAELVAAEARIAARRAAVPEITYPEQLPVTARRDDIAAAIAAHQVVVIAGETGSGKTTQIPKICLELGRGVRGTIGHTQPRRLAARTVAERIAAELGTEIGETVGYTVRFTDEASEATLIKLMTDGILLAEIQRDRLLRRYDTIIIDEAHERSLNIDFLLGYLKQLLPRRPDLKVIITSATIDPELFARHFDAPIVEVSGRTFPVEIRYRPVLDEDPVDAIGAAVQELFAAGDGDVLVFLSGEREIRDTADGLRDLKLRNTEILPLYARLSTAEQHRVFAPHAGRRVVLATNVAETSLTVPGIRYVIDAGTARISRYSLRLKVQRLPIEPISQASARQRSGRCGRVADGIAIRLYAEEDFESRPAFTEPEILRTNLAAVVLQMAAMELGDLEDFPFVEAPDKRNVRDGVALLEELGALAAGKLTPIGRQLAQLPVDPRMARMLAAAHTSGCLREMLIIVAALSIQDVRERPAEHQQAADTAHARFTVEHSDFLAYLKLWDYLREQRKLLSSNQFRKMCKTEFLHWLRIREWQDLHGQLRQITAGLGWHSHAGGHASSAAAGGEDRADEWSIAPAASATIHQALLSGLLSHIGVREAETREFLGARGAKFAIFPGSTLARKPPQFVMAGELVETSRLWARTAARIEPEWAEKLAAHLVKRTYSEPHWSSKRGAAMAYERVTLYGVPLVAKRLVGYGNIDAEVSRELFVRHALVQGEWTTRHHFFARNRALLEDVEELENRARRRDILVDDEALFQFYDARIPAEVVSARHFDGWWKQAHRADPDLLDFTPDALRNPDAAAVLSGDYPDAWRQGEIQFPLTYQFEPGTADDGVTAHIPVALLAQVRDVGFDWLVPGMRPELVAALIKTLPKQVRRAVVPAPDFAAAALASMTARSEPLPSALARELTRLSATPIAATDFAPDTLPDHLRMTFAAVDGTTIVRKGKDLPALRAALAGRTEAAVAKAAATAERAPATVWTAESLGTLAPSITRRLGGQDVTGYPALVVESGGVAVRVLPTAAEQAAAMRAGTRALLLAAVTTPPKAVFGSLTPAQRLTVSQNPDGSLAGLLDDCRAAAVDELIAAHGGPVRSPAAFDKLTAAVRAELTARVSALVRLVVPVLEQARQVQLRLESAPRDIAEDVRDQLDNLVFEGFVTDLGTARLREVPRYLEGAVVRLDALPASATRDRQAMATLDRVYAAYDRLLQGLPEPRRGSPEVVDVAWLFEELRISLFAQRLGTPFPISEQRIMKAIKAIR